MASRLLRVHRLDDMLNFLEPEFQLLVNDRAGALSSFD